MAVSSTSIPPNLPCLFEKVVATCATYAAAGLAPRVTHRLRRETEIQAALSSRTIDVFDRATDPRDPLELRDLFIGRVESELGALSIRPDLAKRWNDSRPLRRFTADEILRAPATSTFVKEVFNFFFRDDLYGSLRRQHNLILSSGTADERFYGMPKCLKDCVRYALDRDWYGYSDSRGRNATREAIARLESARVPNAGYGLDSVSITMGGTFSMNAVADFVLNPRPAAPALCLLPNYPPLVEAVGRRAPVQMVPTVSGRGRTHLQPLIEALRPDTPLVMLQTVSNPTGCRVDEKELEALIRAAAPNTIVVCDESHECSGTPILRSPLRAAPHVVRMVSLSKSYSVPGLKLGWLVACREFVREFYEYASTSYGGPPSIFYLLVEVASRFERWFLEGIKEPAKAELREFDSDYGLDLDTLCRAYDEYLRSMADRERRILGSRAWLEEALADCGFNPITADYSVNLAIRTPCEVDSYVFFRRTLAETDVAVYPGVLNLLFDEPCFRVTSARDPRVLERAVAGLAQKGVLPTP